MVTKYSAEDLYGDLFYTLPDSTEFVLASDYAALEAELAAEKTNAHDTALLSAGWADACAELRAELARVKAESLRVVVSSDTCYLSDCKERFYIQPKCCHDREVTPNNIQSDSNRHPDTTVLPLRLERWENAK